MQKTYNAQGIVLRKTKLGESDLIITFLIENGSQVRAVAKGARKPAGSFAARLELYSLVDMLLAQGRTLDIVKEVRLKESNEGARADLEHSACAAPMVELLDRISQTGLENPRLFALTKTALASLSRVDTANAPAVCAAHLLKTFAFAGIRPCFDRCAVCGSENSEVLSRPEVFLSYREGGVLCPACAAYVKSRLVPKAVISWCQALLGMTFVQIEALETPLAAMFDILHFCREWAREHAGVSLKSLDFLFTCTLF